MRSGPLQVSIFLGWLVGFVLFAAWLLYGSRTHQPEIGVIGFLFLGGATLSGFYLINVLFLLLPSHYFLFPVLPHSAPWQWGLVGSLLFGLTDPLWITALGGQPHRPNTLILAAISAAAGGAAFYETRRRHPEKVMPTNQRLERPVAPRSNAP